MRQQQKKKRDENEPSAADEPHSNLKKALCNLVSFSAEPEESESNFCNFDQIHRASENVGAVTRTAFFSCE